MRFEKAAKRAALTLAASALLFTSFAALAKEERKPILNGSYTFELTKCSGGESRLSDYSHKSCVRIRAGSSIRVLGPAAGEDHANAVYLYLHRVPEWFSLTWYDAAGAVMRTDEYGTENDPVYQNCLYLKEYAITVPEGAAGMEFVSGSDGYVAELRLYADAADVPETAECWEPSFDKADILLVAAHPDDEHLMMGGLIPMYAGDRGKKLQMVYLTADLTARKAEAMRGLWVCGVRNVPVFLDLVDKKTMGLDAAIAVWQKRGDDPEAMIVEQIRRFKPEIVVSHDVNGEYGHGAHRAAAYYTLDAVEKAADASCYPESAEKYGVWQVKKCYLHLYGDEADRTVLPVDEPLAAFGGKTAFEMAEAGFHEHEGTQGDDWYSLLRSRAYDCASYGLAFTTVGPDEAKNDLFEHLEGAAQ